MDKEFLRLKKLDDDVYRLYKNINVDLLNPINLEEEKKKFFSNTNYNPVFEYGKLNVSFSKLKNEIKKIKFGNSPLDRVYRDKIEEIINIIKLLENIGGKDFTEYSFKVFGKPSKELVKKANKIISKGGKFGKSVDNISAEKVVEKIEYVLRNLNLDWRVELRDIVAKMSVNPSGRKLLVNRNAVFSEKELERLIIHEIYTHVLRTEFGMRQPFRIFQYGFPGYISTEEGLALYKEKNAGYLDNRELKKYAGRVIAIDYALKHSFSDTFDFLVKHYSKEEAWKMTVRVKRGLKDTSEKGAYTKDLVYLKGFYEVSNFIKNQSCLHLLHYGKISVKHALLIPLIEHLRNPFVIITDEYKKKLDDICIIYHRKDSDTVVSA